MPQENPEEEKDPHAEAYQALTVFCNRYDPATKDTATGFFSSKEIQRIILDHIGIAVKLDKIYELMVEMKYTYVLQDEQFMWMVRE